MKFRASDPLALYIHVPKPPVTYPELSGKFHKASSISKFVDEIIFFYLVQYIFILYFSEFMFSAPFYLENLLDTERFQNYQINDPVTFLNSLILVGLHSLIVLHLIACLGINYVS